MWGKTPETQSGFQKTEKHMLLKNIKYLEQLSAAWDRGLFLFLFIFF